jgi:hypothetical protein
MHMFAFRESADDHESVGDPTIQDDPERPFIEVEGIEGSILRATIGGLIVSSSGSHAAEPTQRRWAYEQIQTIRVDAYGAIGVIRATIRGNGSDLPLLLLEPDQITAARRSLELIWNLMAARADARLSA